jgi:hypothetical protein
MVDVLIALPNRIYGVNPRLPDKLDGCGARVSVSRVNRFVALSQRRA